MSACVGKKRPHENAFSNDTIIKEKPLNFDIGIAHDEIITAVTGDFVSIEHISKSTSADSHETYDDQEEVRCSLSRIGLTENAIQYVTNAQKSFPGKHISIE